VEKGKMVGMFNKAGGSEKERRIQQVLEVFDLFEISFLSIVGNSSARARFIASWIVCGRCSC
jgi:hypothetical protein